MLVSLFLMFKVQSKMKFALTLAVLAIAVSCNIAQNITTWGDVHSSRLVNTQRVVAPFQVFRVQNRTATYNTVSLSLSLSFQNLHDCGLWNVNTSRNLINNHFQTAGILIRGIMHIDFQTTFSRPRISAGGIGFRTASVNIVSQRSFGINSTVRFYI